MKIESNRVVLGALVALVAVAQPAFSAANDAVERGRYLAAAGNCISCHTPEGGAAFSGGRAFATPFGTMYSTNITPDDATGLGKWTEQQFSDALRKGVRPDGQHLYPAFPYPAFTKLSDADVSALYAYFRTVQRVNSPAKENELGFPYNQRWGLGLWKALYFEEKRFVPEAGKSAQWNRGKYLVEGLGHCGACHTPRNFLGAEKAELALTGGTYTDEVNGKLAPWSATNLTSAHSGLKSWSEDQIFSYLKLGISAKASVSGPMNEVVMNSMQNLNDGDLRAIAGYLKTLPALEQPSGSPADAETMQRGSLVYDVHCGTCHLPTGLGSESTGPALVGNPVTLAPDPASLINITLYGPPIPRKSPSQEFTQRRWQAMGAFSEKLSDEEAADLLSFIRGSWDNKSGAVSASQVAKQR